MPSKITLEMSKLLMYLNRLLWNHTMAVTHLWSTLKGWKWCWRLSGCKREGFWCLHYVRLGFFEHQLDSKSACDYCQLYSVVTGNYFKASVEGNKMWATEMKHLNLFPPLTWTDAWLLFQQVLQHTDYDNEDHLFELLRPPEVAKK